MPMIQTRRRFLITLSLFGAAGLFQAQRAAAAEAPLETTTIRLVNDRSICIAPEYVAEEFLRAEGFTDIRYIEAPGGRWTRFCGARSIFSTSSRAKEWT